MNEKFNEFKADWLTKHPGYIPEKHEPILHGKWARMQSFFVFLSASIVSGVHTIPAINATIPLSIPISNDIKWIASAFGYGAVELAIFQSARYRMDSIAAKAALLLSLIAAITTNVYSGLTSQTDDLGRAIAIILGVVMPLIALMSGEQWSKLERADITEINRAKELDKRDDMEMDKVINAAFTRYENKGKAKSKPVSEPVPVEEKVTKVERLAMQIIEDGYYNQSITALEAIYPVYGRGTIQRAKERARELQSE